MKGQWTKVYSGDLPLRSWWVDSGSDSKYISIVLPEVLMIYKSFFYECLVNLYFKKKYFLEAFQGQIYVFNNRYIYLVKKTT